MSGPAPARLLAAARAVGADPRAVPLRRAAGRLLNAAVSLAEGDWVVLEFSDAPLGPGWLEKLEALIQAAPERMGFVLHPADGPGTPTLAVRRRAFAYGAFDEEFESGRLAPLDWARRIFPAQGFRPLPWDGLDAVRADFVRPGWPPVDNPGPALMRLWPHLDDADRAALLEQALADAGALAGGLDALRGRCAARAACAGADPYRQGAYEPGPFWNAVTCGYVKWEAHQPDEPEIRDIVRAAAPGSVLELGCGAGRNARYFSRAASWTGLDIAPALLAKAADRREANWLGLLRGDVTALPFADGSFDLVFADSTLQHVPPARIAGCLAEMARVSRRHVALIEFTAELPGRADWFSQVHMFRHDYPALMAAHGAAVLAARVAEPVQPAVKTAYLFARHEERP